MTEFYGHPYPGFRPFKSKEKGSFSGRKECVEEIFKRIDKQNRLITIIGESGCGKTSLVQAGLIPKLRDDTSSIKEVAFKKNWMCGYMRPGLKPLENLSNAIKNTCEIDLQFKSGEGAGVDIVELLEKNGKYEDNLLLVIDQFEDIFKFEDKYSENEINHFINTIYNTCHNKFTYDITNAATRIESKKDLYDNEKKRLQECKPDKVKFNTRQEIEVALGELKAIEHNDIIIRYAKLPVVVIIILLNDEFPTDYFKTAKIRDIPNSVYPLQQMTREQLLDAICEPVKDFHFPYLVTKTDAENLSKEFIIDGSDYYSLWRIQHYLRRMYDKKEGDRLISEERYDKIGNIENALNKQLDEIYDKLDDRKKKKIAKILFCRLVDSMDKPLTTLEDIVNLTEEHEEDVINVINEFRGEVDGESRNFLMIPFHEDLQSESILDVRYGKIIFQNWKKLREWKEEEEEIRNAHSPDASLMKKLKELEEKNQQKNTILKLITIIFLLLIFVVLATFFYFKKDYQFNDLTRKFEMQTDHLKEQIKKSKKLADDYRNQADKRKSDYEGTVDLLLEAEGDLIHHKHKMQREKELDEQLDIFMTKLDLASNIWPFVKQASRNQFLTREDCDDFPSHSRIPVSLRNVCRLRAWYVKQKFRNPLKTYKIETENEPLGVISVSSDGKLLGVGGKKGHLFLFNTGNQKLLRKLSGHREDIQSIAFVPGGKYLAAGDSGNNIIIHPLNSDTGKKTVKTEIIPNAIAPSTDGKYLALPGENNYIKIYDIQNNLDDIRELRCGDIGTVAKNGLFFNNKGNLLASMSENSVCFFLKPKPTSSYMKERAGYFDHPNLEYAGFLWNGKRLKGSMQGKEADKYLLATCSKSKLAIWEWGAEQNNDEPYFQKVVEEHPAPDQRVIGILPHLKGYYLVSEKDQRIFYLWDAFFEKISIAFTGHKEHKEHKGHSKPLTGITVSGQYAYTCSEDGTAMQWSLKLPSQPRLLKLEKDSAAPLSIAISPDTEKAAIGLKDGTLILCSLSLNVAQELDRYPMPRQNGIDQIRFFPNGSNLLTSDHSNCINYWQIIKDTLNYQEELPKTKTVKEIDFAANDDSVFIAHKQGKIKILKLKDGKLVEKNEVDIPKEHENDIVSIYAASEAGGKNNGNNDSRILTCGKSGNIILSTVATDGSLMDNKLMKENVEGLEWAVLSPDEKKIAVAGKNSVFIAREDVVKDGKKIKIEDYHLPIEKRETRIHRAIFSPDSRQVLTLCSDATIRFWDIVQKEQILFLKLPKKGISDFDFRCTQNGCKIAVPIYDKNRITLVIYDLEDIYRTGNPTN